MIKTTKEQRERIRKYELEILILGGEIVHSTWRFVLKNRNKK